MRRTWYHVGLLLCTFLFSFGLLPELTRAQSATPTLPGSSSQQEFCTEAEIFKGEIFIEESPVGAALIGPASASDMDLYVVKVTLPPDTCVAYTSHYLHDGAAIWLIDDGTVEFDFQPITGWPAPNLTLERNDGTVEPVAAQMELKTGDWVAADRAVNYSYRNIGDGNAAIIMTVFENRVTFEESEPSPIITIAGGCKGVCRRR
jgi:hypothetical protein